MDKGRGPLWRGDFFGEWGEVVDQRKRERESKEI